MAVKLHPVSLCHHTSSPLFVPYLCSCLFITCEKVYQSMPCGYTQAYKICRNSRYKRNLISQRLNKANRCVSIAPYKSCYVLPSKELCLKHSQLSGELAQLLADSSGTGVGNTFPSLTVAVISYCLLFRA